MCKTLNIQTALELASTIESDSPQLDAAVLLAHILKVDATYLRTWPDKELSSEQVERYQRALQDRREGKPVAHITGTRGFWSLDLNVNASTLIPRPDTETLVEAVLDSFDDAPRSVLDLGTGTGAIALALASERSNWTILATDYSHEALELARSNAKANGLMHVQFAQGSWFEALKSDQRFDLIVSNPPYISDADTHLDEGDVRFEPRSALVAEDEGLADLRHIADEARHRLNAGAKLFMEHGYDQGSQLRAMLVDLGYQGVGSGVDYGGNERFTYGEWSNE